MMSRVRYWLIVALMIGIIAPAGVLAHAQENPGKGVIKIRVTGLRNDKGRTVCTLCSSPEGYPSDCKKQEITSVPIHHDKADCIFPNKAPGSYAATVFHDEDLSGKFKRNFIGIPQEGFGFSNNYRPTVRAPTWKEAAFGFPGGEETITINIINW
ncbi:MAG TPA: DUF2141 domain-containing protein [Candidatus Binataceae bacterium]|nr:DUF2141 domain-containing protein [Candidatus Binataceae bacterium]